MINPIETMYKQLVKLSGIDGKINNTSCRFLICEETDNNENNYDLKYIVTDQPITQGDYITFNDNLFMIIDIEKPINSVYTKGTFRKVIRITLQSNLKDIYAVVDKIRGVFSQGIITEVHDEYNFIVPKSVTNMTSSNLSNNAFIYAGGFYKIISIDDSKEGILIITGRFSEIYISHVYDITLSSNSKALKETETYQISAICTDDNTVVENPTIIYTSLDENIATVSETGLITGIGVGSATIKCRYNNVSADLTIIVEAKPVEPVISYNSAWTNGTSLKYMVASTCTFTKTISGVVDSTFTGANINYTLDENGQSLLSQSKITVTVGTTTPTIQIRNKTTTASTIYLTVKDSATDVLILDNVAIALIGM